MSQYAIVIEGDGSTNYSSYAPDLPGVVATGESLEECEAAMREVFHDANGVFHRAGTANRVAGPAPDHKTYGSRVSFADLDGNTWYVQEVTTRAAGPGHLRAGRL